MYSDMDEDDRDTRTDVEHLIAVFGQCSRVRRVRRILLPRGVQSDSELKGREVRPLPATQSLSVDMSNVNSNVGDIARFPLIVGRLCNAHYDCTTGTATLYYTSRSSEMSRWSSVYAGYNSLQNMSFDFLCAWVLEDQPVEHCSLVAMLKRREAAFFGDVQ